MRDSEMDDLEAQINASLHDDLGTQPANAEPTTTETAPAPEPAATTETVDDSTTTSEPAPGPTESNAADAAKTDVSSEAQPTATSVTDAEQQLALLRAQVAEQKRLLEGNTAELDQLRQQAATNTQELRPYTDEEIEDLEARFGEDLAEQFVESRNELVLARQERAATREGMQQTAAQTQEEQLRSVLSANAPTVHKWRLEWQAMKEGEVHPQFAIAQRVHEFVTSVYPDHSPEQIAREVEKRTLAELGQTGTTAQSESTGTTREIGGHKVVDTTIPDSLNGVSGASQLSGDAALEQKIRAGQALTPAEEAQASALLGL